MKRRLRIFALAQALAGDPVFLILGFGVALRLIFAFTDIAMVYPDEQFQVLEPANWIVNGVGWKTWEWHLGSRSWFVPGLYLPLLGFLRLIGIHEGPILIHACKALNAILDGVFLWSFAELLALRGFSPIVRWITLSVLALSPAMIAWSSTTFSDHWLMLILWISLPTLLRTAKDGDRKQGLGVGVVMGLAFVVRVQAVLWLLGLLFCLKWPGRSGRGKNAFQFRAFLFGFALPVLGLGVLDWATWGRPFQSVYENVRLNVFGGVASSNGISPWYAYFIKIENDVGWPFTLFWVTALGFLLWKRKSKLDSSPRSAADALVLVPAALFFGGHCLVAHKETRFILPVLPALFYVLAHGLEAAAAKYPEWVAVARRWARPVPISVGVLLLGILALRQTHIAPRRAWGDLSSLSAVIYRDHGFSRAPDACFLFVDHSWLWTRGEMLFGQALRYVQIKHDKPIESEHLRNCLYSVMPGWAETKFSQALSAMPTANWKKIAHDNWGNVAYRNEDLFAK